MPARICAPPISIPRTTIASPPRLYAGDAPSAIDGDCLSGNGPRIFAEQEDRGAGDVAGVDHASGERLFFLDEGEQLGRPGALAGRRPDEAGRKHVDTNPVRRVERG